MNHVTLIGRLTADPEPRQTNSGISLCTFNLAVDRKYKNKDGNKAVDFIYCQAWRGGADLITQYTKKGDQIGVSGSLQIDRYETADGEKRTRAVVVVQDVTFCSKRSSSAGNNATYKAPEADPYTDDGDTSLPFDI